jgi:hypothetical protein
VPNIAVKIIDMEYKGKDNEVDDVDSALNNSKDKIATIRKSRSEFPSISIGKSSFRDMGVDYVPRPSTNFMISLAKFRVLLILNHLLDGFEVDDYVYYLYRRSFTPTMFRKNFAYQDYFYNHSFRGEYRTSLFFSYYQNLNKKDMSPYIAEIGFEFYFLLKKMEENFTIDPDETFHKK